MKRWIAVALVVLAAFAPGAGAASLPAFRLEHAVLHAKLIVEARPVEQARVEVTRVHYGDAKPGDRITLTHFDDLPRIAREDPDGHSAGKPEIPIKDQDAVLFLQPTVDGGWQPVAWGTGVKWVVGERVFGYSQPTNPGNYVLMPDREAGTIQELRTRIASELERRKQFEQVLTLLDPAERARGLLRHVFEEPRGVYSIAAHAAFRGAGPEATRVLAVEARKDRSGEDRLTFAELLLLAGGGGAQYVAVQVEQEAWAVVDRIPTPLPEWNKLAKEQQSALGQWHRALSLIASDSTTSSNQNDTMRKALGWGLHHLDPRAVSEANRAFSGAPESSNVADLARAIREWPAGEAGEGGVHSPSIREEMVRVLAAQRFPQVVPVLADLLEDSQAGVRDEARRGLTRIVGKDLGADPAPWFDWLGKLGRRESPAEK